MIHAAHRGTLALLTIPSLIALATPPASAQSPLLIPERGFTSDGAPTPAWRAALAGLRGPDAALDPSGLRAPTAREAAWAEALQTRTACWQAEVPALSEPFAPMAIPTGVRVLVGFQGGEDAFSPEARTLAFDVARLADIYGDPALPENRARMDRFFRHEYTHVLQKAWLAAHPFPADSPLRSALLEIWKEGLGNFHSLSDRWVSPQGDLTAEAHRTLEVLAPRFVARVAALTGAAPAPARLFQADLSWGPFDRKWGALPVALWLAQARRHDPDSLRAHVRAGPAGIWELADRNLPEALRSVWREVHAAAQLASRP